MRLFDGPFQQFKGDSMPLERWVFWWLPRGCAKAELTKEVGGGVPGNRMYLGAAVAGNLLQQCFDKSNCNTLFLVLSSDGKMSKLHLGWRRPVRDQSSSQSTLRPRDKFKALAIELEEIADVSRQIQGLPEYFP